MIWGLLPWSAAVGFVVIAASYAVRGRQILGRG